jgi:S-adenosylmethionine hydrolase
VVRVTLLTDFGTDDGFVGAMKGVLATEAPQALVEDISHQVPPGDVAKASRVLGRYWREYPPGTVHLVVVDPGVGTPRRGLALEADGRLLVGPDNGVFGRVLSEATVWTAVDLSETDLLPAPSSATFHGRDWFAPAAALLAEGAPLQALGAHVMDPMTLVGPEPSRVGDWLVGEVQEVDRFGNLATNIPGDEAERVVLVEMMGTRIARHGTYGDAEVGELLALLNSDGLLEVAVRDGSAARMLGAGPGTPVRARVRRPT